MKSRIGIGEFDDEMRGLLREFYEFWRTKSFDDPKSYPLRMTPLGWFTEFAVWYERMREI